MSEALQPSKMNVKELRAELEKRNESTKGLKAELINRLENAISLETYCRDLERERERLKREDEWEDEWANEQYILKLPEVQEDLEADLEAADLEAAADWVETLMDHEQNMADYYGWVHSYGAEEEGNYFTHRNIAPCGLPMLEQLEEGEMVSKADVFYRCPSIYECLDHEYSGQEERSVPRLRMIELYLCMWDKVLGAGTNMVDNEQMEKFLGVFEEEEGSDADADADFLDPDLIYPFLDADPEITVASKEPLGEWRPVAWALAEKKERRWGEESIFTEGVVRRGEVLLDDGEWHACWAQRSLESLEQQHPDRPSTWDILLTVDTISDTECFIRTHFGEEGLRGHIPRHPEDKSSMAGRALPGVREWLGYGSSHGGGGGGSGSDGNDGDDPADGRETLVRFSWSCETRREIRRGQTTRVCNWLRANSFGEAASNGRFRKMAGQFAVYGRRNSGHDVTPLILACSVGNLDMCRLLVEHSHPEPDPLDGFDNDCPCVDQCSTTGGLPTHYAAENGHCHVMSWLIEETRRTFSSSSSLSGSALASGERQVISALESDNDVGWTPLMFAANGGHLSMCRLICDEYAAATEALSAAESAAPAADGGGGGGGGRGGAKKSKKGRKAKASGVLKGGDAAQEAEEEEQRRRRRSRAALELVRTTNKAGNSAFMLACAKGHLDVLRYFHSLKEGADKDRNEDQDEDEDGDEDLAAVWYMNRRSGYSALLMACANGRLPVCQWLFDAGADTGIARARARHTPMQVAFRNGHLPVCQWLVLNGALNRPAAPAHHEAGHVDVYIVRRDCRIFESPFELSGATVTADLTGGGLRDWARDVVVANHIFLHVVLRASVILPSTYHQVSPDQRCHLPRLPGVVLKGLAGMLGVEMGRRLRNVREFGEAFCSRTFISPLSLPAPFPWLKPEDCIR